MEIITKSKMEIQREIHSLNVQIENNTRLLNDYRALQTGEFDKNEIRQENENIKLERNQLLSLL